MAWSTVETKIANPATGRRKGKRNMAAKRKRHLRAKQIKHFGTKRQKAALKAKRHNAAKHRPRTKKRANPISFGKGTGNRKARRARAAGKYKKRDYYKKTSAERLTRRKKKNSSHRPRAKKKNPELVSFFLGNSARKRSKKGMARHYKRKKKSAASRSNAGRRRTKKTVHHFRRKHRNPGLMGIGKPMDWALGGAGALAGFVGSAAIPQMLMPTSNTGMTGYALSAASTIGLAILAHMMLPRMPAVAVGVASGGFANLLRRIITDQTPFGSYLNAPAPAGLGMGDYMVANWGPPRMSDGLHSAMAQAPGTPWSGGGMVTTSSGVSTQDMMDIRSSRPC
jgi:hypothetical protein